MAGLDGCPSGWVGVLVDLNGIQPPRQRLFASLQDVLEAPEVPHVITVDMPIGFEDAPSGKGGRACERAARAILGARRSSVFASPLRSALYEPDYQAAMAANRAAGGPGLSKQSYMLFRKMREIDQLMSPVLEGCVHEVHPEVSFTAISGSPMQHNKKTPEGRAERLAVLTAHGLPAELFEPHPYRRKDAVPDDLVDAGVCALSAVRLARGEAISLPEDPPRDGKGLRMAIWA